MRRLYRAMAGPFRRMGRRVRQVALGPELRGSATLGRTSSGGSTATVAAIDLGSGSGTVYRVSAGDQTFIQFSGLDGTGTYHLSVANGGPGALSSRLTSSGGTLVNNLSSGASANGVAIVMNGATVLTLTCGTNTSSAAFSGLSLRKVG